ncbi:unnamed protein product, partial [Urochloa humidicola]
ESKWAGNRLSRVQYHRKLNPTSDARELFPDGATRSWRPRGNEAVARGGRVAARHILDGDGDDDRIRRLLARARHV